MSSVRIYLPDNSVKTFDHEPTVLEVAQSIGPRLAKDTLGGQLDGSAEVVDLRTVLKDGTKLKIITPKDPVSLEVVRHSAAHLMAQAVQELWPEVKVTIGPVIENGFYYDFDSPRTFTPEDLEKVDKKMNELLARNEEVVREDWPSDKAIATFEKMGERFKAEIIRDLNTSSVGIYKQGDKWFDLCRGPHVQRMGQIKAVKTMSLAGAYWRGDEKNAQLQRIYATAFNDKKDLEEYLQNLEEAKKRDHRKLGKELGLFYFNPLAPGSPFFAPKGAVIYNELLDLMRDKYRKYGYQEVITPQVYDVELFHTSGHYENYRENMYFSRIEERDFSLKPMNCPGHCVLYGAERKSYRDLPWRIADFGRLHRYERSGVMHGLTRVRTFCQDDAHIFCRMDQLQTEIASFMTMLNEVYHTLGMSQYHIYLSTRPEKRMGSDAYWDRAEGALSEALDSLGLAYTVNPGDGAFYGPKLDIMFVDAMKRPWQLGTLQVDPNLPDAFKLEYVGEDNKEHRPIMLHRAILGSLERFIGVYLEHTAGHLPVWMSPLQVAFLTVTDRQLGYARKLEKELKTKGVRAWVDERGEKLGYKIREAQLQKVPYMIILGDKEVESDTVSVRLKNGTELKGIPFAEFSAKLEQEIKERRLESILQPAPVKPNQEANNSSI
ncbi:MAG: threonine--tRNA ligase [Bdellovibrionales bacterium]|nr:threonine--tRNA ligase [Bdellovibrionales bacterium]